MIYVRKGKLVLRRQIGGRRLIQSSPPSYSLPPSFTLTDTYPYTRPLTHDDLDSTRPALNPTRPATRRAPIWRQRLDKGNRADLSADAPGRSQTLSSPPFLQQPAARGILAPAPPPHYSWADGNKNGNRARFERKRGSDPRPAAA